MCGALRCVASDWRKRSKRAHSCISFDDVICFLNQFRIRSILPDTVISSDLLKDWLVSPASPYLSLSLLLSLTFWRINPRAQAAGCCIFITCRRRSKILILRRRRKWWDMSSFACARLLHNYFIISSSPLCAWPGWLGGTVMSLSVSCSKRWMINWMLKEFEWNNRNTRQNDMNAFSMSHMCCFRL